MERLRERQMRSGEGEMRLRKRDEIERKRYCVHIPFPIVIFTRIYSRLDN